MKGKTAKLVTALIAAGLVVVVPLANAKPIKYLGQGCAYTILINPGMPYTQSFKPTFSILKKAELALFNYSTAGAEDKMFYVDLHDNVQGFVARSETATLSADTSYDDAISGGTVTFTFGGGVAVRPGDIYYLHLYTINNEQLDAWLCYGPNFYPDGFFFYSPSGDMEFAVFGTGPGK